MIDPRVAALWTGFSVLLATWLTSIPLPAQTATAETHQWSRQTPWGDPDLQGVWTTWDETLLEAPVDPAAPAAADRRAAVAAAKAAAQTELERHLAEAAGGGMSQLHGSPTSSRRLSLVVDPPNGRIPVVPGKADRRPNIRAMQDTWEAHSTWERCLARGVLGRNLEPGGNYDKAYRILQTPDFTVIAHEEIHDARIIPMDGRPHVGKEIQLWHGDSRGRWEGQSLVIETTNFNDRGPTGYGGGRQTGQLRLVERYTRLDENTLNFEVTLEDPTQYARPWTARAPHNLDPQYVIYEYACHEGNANYMEGSLRAGRVRDAEEAAASKNKETPATPKNR